MVEINNKVYESQRNSLISEAETFADRRFGKTKKEGQDPEEYSSRWNFCYHQKMNELYKERFGGQ